MTTNGTPVSARQPARGLANRRNLLLALLAFTVLSMIAGGAYAFHHRHDTICRDRRPPVQQLDEGLGQIKYRCHDGQIVERG